MCHSEQIADVYYREPVRNVSAGEFASRIVDSMAGPVDDTDHDTNNASANVQESTQDEVTDPGQEGAEEEEGATAGKVSAQHRILSQAERDFICFIFIENGKLPESIEFDQVDIAVRRSPAFSLFYSRLVEDMGGIDPANKKLSSCIQGIHRQNKQV